MKRPPLHLYLFAHPDSAIGNRVASALMARFVEPPASGGLRIPVSFTPDRGDFLPPPLQGREALDLDAAEHSLVVLLADGRMVRTQGPDATGEAWIQFADKLFGLAPLGSSAHHVLPVALDQSGLTLAGGRHAIPALIDAEAPEGEDRRLSEISFHIAARAIQLLEVGTVAETAADQFKAPVRLFISHAKADLGKDGDDPAHRTLQARTDIPVEDWVDAGKIAPGQAFEKAIHAGLRDCSIVLAFYTDHYGSRPWCRREVLDAKRLGGHILVVDALRDAEPRLFPYLGNVPVVRWQYRDPGADARRVVDRAVREALRFKHNRALMGKEAAGEVPLPTAPEALTLTYEYENPGKKKSRKVKRGKKKTRKIQTGEKKTFLYPDPPLGREELDVLRKLRPNARFITPLTRVAERYRANRGDVVGVSISVSNDPERYGLSAAHQDTLSDEVHLYLLAAGLRIAYGGALQGNLGVATNFTLRLFELVRGYSPLLKSALGPDGLAPILNFPPWPVVLGYGDAEWSLFGKEAHYVATPRPELPWADDEIFPPRNNGWRFEARDPRQRYAWARGLTPMREQMTTETRARVVIGGRLTTFQGLVPGVVEEAWMSLRSKHPLFLVGAFGGAARAVSDLLTGVDRPEFSDSSARGVLRDYDAAAAYFAEHGGELVSMARMGDELRDWSRLGLAAALNNGLTDTENQELILSADAPRIAELILTGLSRLRPSQARG